MNWTTARYPLFFLAAALLTTGCASYKHPSVSYAPDPKDSSYALQEKALTNSLYNVIPRKREQIRWYDLGHWAASDMLGNDEDGVFGENAGFSTNITRGTFWRWQLRNPLHNFDFYTIGSAGWKRHRHLSIIAADKSGAKFFTTHRVDVVGKGKAAFQLTFNDYKPFVSLKLWRFETYLGWRDKGDFGVALRGSRR